MPKKLPVILMLLALTLGQAQPGQAQLRSRQLGQALTKAAWYLDSVKVRNLLQNGVDPNTRRLIDGVWRTPITALLYGSESQDSCLPMLKLLVAHGSDINRRDGEGNTPLLLSSGIGSPRVVRFLLTHGANINARDAQGRTALSRAACWTGSCGDGISPENGELVIKAGVDENIADRKGITPLMYLAAMGDEYDGELEFLHLMLAHGANPRLRDRRGHTVLQSVRMEERISGHEEETIRLLKQWLTKPKLFARSRHLPRIHHKPLT